MSAEREYTGPSPGEKLFNRAFGFLAGFGFAPRFIYLLEVRGRKSGKLYSTAINLLELNGKKFLVAPRGRTQWVRNAEAAGEVILKRGARRRYRLRPLADSEKPAVLKTYLTNYKSAVAKFFPVKANSPVEDFAQIAAGYPVFELFDLPIPRPHSSSPASSLRTP
jgi:deazaflavin-dependent oxidoreductase (nitroreductase family)